MPGVAPSTAGSYPYIAHNQPRPNSRISRATRFFADPHAVSAKLGMDPRRAVGFAGGRVESRSVV
jgi:hypothetical protein